MSKILGLTNQGTNDLLELEFHFDFVSIKIRRKNPCRNNENRAPINCVNLAHLNRFFYKHPVYFWADLYLKLGPGFG